MNRQKPQNCHVARNSGFPRQLLPFLALCLTISLYFAPHAPATGQVYQKSREIQKTGNVKKKSIHARPWAFDIPAKSDVRPWQHGESTKTLQEKAVIGKDGEKMVYTSSTIDNTLQKANEQSGRMGLSIRNESSSLRESLRSDAVNSAENPTRTGRHMVGAFVDVRSGDDLSIRLGPELILKDKQSLERSDGNQPDSAIGLDMQFKLDF